MTTQSAPAARAAAAENQRVLGMSQALGEALDIAMAQDETVFELGEDIHDPTGGGFGLHRGLSTKYGLERVRPTPISEQAIMGAAIGAAMTGMRPVAEIMLMNFLSVCADQLVNHAAKLRYMSGGQTHVPLVVRTTTGAGGGFGAQHSDMLEGPLAHTPGLKVVVPSTAADAKGLLLSSIFDDDPVVFVEMSRLYYTAKDHVPEGDHRVPLGKARTVRAGRDVTLVSWGRQVHDCAKVADRLAGQGIDAEVLDLRTLTPLDRDAIMESVGRTKRVVIVHEAVRRGGFGAELAADIGEELYGELSGPIRRVGAPETPVPYASNLEAEYMPHEGRIEAAVTSLF
ncbi:transketolase C-terminal domain-containing protein [Streptomyces sp. NPDC048106]|uniref:alpha-ketoacid dehydrogenase subunit beta n=1 Tax=Streptomyces sp. NPDC048106 TaxID=3155750 RepID=UPI0034536F28